jgi:hypothetical protein
MRLESRLTKACHCTVRTLLRDQLVAGEGDVTADATEGLEVDGLFWGATVIEEEDQAGATVEALQLDDLAQGVIEVGGLEEAVEVGDEVGVFVLGGGGAQGDGRVVTEDRFSYP